MNFRSTTKSSSPNQKQFLFPNLSVPTTTETKFGGVKIKKVIPGSSIFSAKNSLNGAGASTSRSSIA